MIDLFTKKSMTCPSDLLSNQQNIVHASDSVENAAIEVARFFRPEEIFDYQSGAFAYVYGDGECK